MGYFTIEEVVRGDKHHTWVKLGDTFTKGPGTYKIPAIDDTPNEFNVYLLKKSENPFAIHGSKAVGEPPFFLGSSVFFAIKEAIKASRKEIGVDEPFDMDCPATCERIKLACLSYPLNKKDKNYNPPTGSN
jgi:xanthine dehydrogenase/oxidase